MLLAAFALHNLEEAIAYRVMHGEIQALLAAWDIPWWSPSPRQFSLTLITLTLAIAVLVAWAARGAAAHSKVRILRILAAVLLINIAVPHVPAALILGGYAPGLLSALAVNLPVGLAALWLLRREPQSR